MRFPGCFFAMILTLRAALANDPAQAEQALQDIQAGKYAKAASLLEEATRRDADNAELWNLLGIADTELGKAREAEQSFDRGLSLTPDSVSLNENSGLLFFREEKYVAAKKRLARAVQLGSENPGVRFSLAASKLRTGEAEAALRELKALEPSLGNVQQYWEERGRAELAANPAAAEVSFERALKIAPESIIALNGAASAAERDGLEEKALSYLIRARTLAPKDVPTLLHFADLCIRRDLGPDAIKALEQARELDPNNSNALYLLARANISVQNWQRAFDLFREYSARHPNFAATYYALGWLDLKLGRVADARQQLEHCLALDPAQADARYELAQLEFDDSHIEKAHSLLETVLRQNPNHAKANMTLGEIMTRSGDLPKARELLEKAVKLDPKLAPAHYKLSVVYARMHESEKAAQERTLAARLSAQEKQQSRTQLRLVLPGDQTEKAR